MLKGHFLGGPSELVGPFGRLRRFAHASRARQPEMGKHCQAALAEDLETGDPNSISPVHQSIQLQDLPPMPEAPLPPQLPPQPLEAGQCSQCQTGPGRFLHSMGQERSQLATCFN